MSIESLIYDYARDGELLRLECLNYYSKSKVTELIHTQVEGSTPLLIACINGHFRIVDYLVRVHNCDIEQVGSISFENEVIDGAPPLWAAAAAGRENIVAYLIGCGARVNHTTRTNSTPLRAACFDGHIHIVDYLIKRGADAEIANYHGHTCLMIACYQNKINIVELLIKAGVNVNRRSEKGNTALHDCSEAGNLNIFKLLLKNNAKMQMDEFNATPLITAASSGNLCIVEFMAKNCPAVSKIEVIKSLMLLGATFVDKDHEIVKGIKYWMFALMRKFRLKVVSGDDYVEEENLPIEAYDNYNQVDTPEELSELSHNVDWIHMQALVIRERILGPVNSDTSYYIRHRGAVYADSGDFDRCMRLWNHAINLQLEHRTPLSLLTQTSFLSFAELFSYLRSDDQHWRYHSVSLDEMVKILALSVYELERSVPYLAGREANKRLATGDYYAGGRAGGGSGCDVCNLRHQCDQLMLVMLHITSLVYSFIRKAAATTPSTADFEATVKRFKKLVYRMIRVSPNGCSEKTFLHLAVKKSKSVIGRYPLSVRPTLPLSRLFVDLGSDVNAKDSTLSTPLHCTLEAAGPDNASIVCLLMDNGAHTDLPDIDGVTAYSLLRDDTLKKANREKISLQCLAASVVTRHYDVNEIGLTSWLREFVDMH